MLVPTAPCTNWPLDMGHGMCTLLYPSVLPVFFAYTPILFISFHSQHHTIAPFPSLEKSILRLDEKQDEQHPHLSGPFAAVTTKEEKLRRALDSLAKDAQERGTANLALVNLTRADWARIASHECPLCGSMMILTCHDPLIGPDEAKEADSWAI
mmetsp:Transcript_19085/g.36979  ORF Transcript_19085/g.36979 Transcript_19085/m.36979 type:complete len:154 (+) Transcript_19085:1185-1646(+)